MDIEAIVKESIESENQVKDLCEKYECTVRQVAEHVDVSERTVRFWRSSDREIPEPHKRNLTGTLIIKKINMVVSREMMKDGWKEVTPEAADECRKRREPWLSEARELFLELLPAPASESTSATESGA